MNSSLPNTFVLMRHLYEFQPESAVLLLSSGALGNIIQPFHFKVCMSYLQLVPSTQRHSLLLFESPHDSRPMQDLARGLNSSRSSWVHGCGRIGQISRCFMVCSSPHLHVVRPSSLNLHFCIRDLHRPVPGTVTSWFLAVFKFSSHSSYTCTTA